MKKIETLKKIFFVCLAFCFAWQANAQKEFAPLGAEWYYTYADGHGPEEHFHNVVSEKDTIIEGHTCRILMQYYNYSNAANLKFIIKQDGGKIYFYHKNKFNLLFDFDVQVNDTVEFTFWYSKDDYNPLYGDTLFSARFQVESIITNTQNLKVFTTKVLKEDLQIDYWGKNVPPLEYQTYSYSEKIGFHREFMPLYYNYSLTAIKRYRWLRCYSDKDFSFVSEEWVKYSLPCNYCISTGINSIKEENTTIYPNPFNDRIFVSMNNEVDIEIIDLSGKIVYNSRLSNGISEISTTNFLKGIYLVKIQNINNSIQIFKIIKS